MADRARPLLLLDVMGTLVHDPFFVEVPAALSLPLAQILAEKDPTSWVEFEYGDLTEEEFLGRFFADGRDYDRTAFVRAFVEGFRFLEGTEPLLAALNRAGVRPHLLSNYPIWYRNIEERLHLSRYADWSFVSCDTRHRKPDAEAYLHAARTLGVTPRDCLFVDDCLKNVQAAARLGMTALSFRDTATLQGDLERLGILGKRP